MGKSKVVEDYNLYKFFPGVSTKDTGGELPGPDGKIKITEEIITPEMVADSIDQHKANVSHGGELQDV